MSNTEKTIEELEAEVMAELEEANGSDAPKKGAVPAEKMDKADGEVQDTGKPVVDPEQKDAPAKKVVAKAKEVSGQKPQKGEGSPDKMDKLAAGDQVDHDGENLAEMEDENGNGDDEEMPKTKMELKTALDKKLNKMNKEQLVAAWNGMKNGNGNGDDEEEEMDEEKKLAIEKRVKSVDVSEHVDALMNGEGDLSEEFKRKAATVFEAAVKSKIRSEVERLEDEYKTELDESIKETKGELSEKVDTYLDYVCQEWMKENELAIERGLKGEIAEDFISGLKQLFEDHYVDVPDEKYDVLEAQSEKITELEGKLNEAISNIVTLRKDKTSLVREKAISEATDDLADTEIEKFKSLTDDVEFTDEASFKEKLGTLKESYFPKTKPVETQTVNDVESGNAQDVDTTDSMHSYMRAIGKFGNGAK